MSEEAQRIKQRRQDGGGGGSTARTSWRGIPDGPLGVVAELVGSLQCRKLLAAHAIRAVFPAALTRLVVQTPRTSNSLHKLAVALAADSAHVCHAACLQRKLALRVAAAIGEALAANNAHWKALELGRFAEAGTSAVLLAHNLDADCGVAIANALHAPGALLRGLHVHGNVEQASAGKRPVDGVKRNRTVRGLELLTQAASDACKSRSWWPSWRKVSPGLWI